jgi:hypothetical protein
VPAFAADGEFIEFMNEASKVVPGSPVSQAAEEFKKIAPRIEGSSLTFVLKTALPLTIIEYPMPIKGGEVLSVGDATGRWRLRAPRPSR